MAIWEVSVQNTHCVIHITQEYEQQSSAESTFVKDLDRLEMCLQAFEYERIQNINLNGFYTSLESIKNDQVRIYADLLIQERKYLFNII